MSDLISRADVLEGLKHSTAYLHDDIYTIVNRIPSAEATGALDEAITKYVADGYMLPPSTLTALPSAEAEQVTGKLKNPCDSLLKADSDECKEQKSKLDLIRREDAIDAIDDAIDADSPQWAILRTKIGFLPSAEAEPTVIRSRTFMPTKDFKKWAERIREVNPNAVVIPCDAEVASAEVQGEWIGYNADKEDWLRTDGTPIFLVCDKCHGIVINNGSAHWNFCPNCGAKMMTKGGGSEWQE